MDIMYSSEGDFCINCSERNSSEEYRCLNCIEKYVVDVNGMSCPICLEPSSLELGVVCTKCNRKRENKQIYIDKNISVSYMWSYSPMSYFLHAYKGRNVKKKEQLIKPLKQLGSCLMRLNLLNNSLIFDEVDTYYEKYDAIIPIPGVAEKLLDYRLEEIIPIRKLLIDNRRTGHFSDNSCTREFNKERFMVNIKHNLKNVILFDDVFTSGTTVNSAAYALKKSGVETVTVFTLCRVTNEEKKKYIFDKNKELISKVNFEMEKEINRVFIIALKEISKIGNVTVIELLSSKKKLPSNKYDLYKWIYTNEKLSNKIKLNLTEDDVIQAYESAERIVEISKEKKISIVTILDKEYPESLRNIGNDIPVILYYKGNINILRKECLAIIGTTKPTDKGLAIGNRLAEIYGEKGYTIVSGLAKGCDTAAHKGALKSDARTVAVLPSAIDDIYPKENIELANEIVESGGCLISEYPVGKKMHKGNLIQRDRVQSGLSVGVIIVEAKEKGGTMVTAEYARKQGRCIACYLPDNEYDEVKGNLKLIDDGAFRLKNSKDINSFYVVLKKEENKVSQSIQIDEECNVEQLTLY